MAGAVIYFETLSFSARTPPTPWLARENKRPWIGAGMAGRSGGWVVGMSGGWDIEMSGGWNVEMSELF